MGLGRFENIALASVLTSLACASDNTNLLDGYLPSIEPEACYESVIEELNYCLTETRDYEQCVAQGSLTDPTAKTTKNGDPFGPDTLILDFNLNMDKKDRETLTFVAAFYEEEAEDIVYHDYGLDEPSIATWHYGETVSDESEVTTLFTLDEDDIQTVVLYAATEACGKRVEFGPENKREGSFVLGLVDSRLEF